MRRMTKIYFYGDSICAGQKFPIHRGWVYQISDKLEKEIGEDVTVSNFSTNGRTTRQALEKMPYEIQSSQPDMLIIQFGMNDCNYWKTDAGHPRVSKESFKANLKEIVARSRHFNIQKIIINTNHPTGLTETMSNTHLSYQESNEEYNALIRQVAHEVDIHLVDVEKKFLEQIKKNNNPRGHYLLEDQLHLNKEGHNLYFKIIYPVLEGLLK